MARRTGMTHRKNLYPGFLAFALAFLLLPALVSGQTSTSKNFKLIQLTDMHLGNVPGHPNIKKCVDFIRAMPGPIEAVVTTGDNVELGIPEHWKYFAEFITEPLKGIPVHAGTGNHETAWSGLEGKRLFRQYTGGPTRYTFDAGEYHFVMLDTSVPAQHHGFAGPEQLAWLDQDLSRTKKTYKVLLLHQCCFLEKYDQFLGDEADLYDLCKKHGVRLLMTGHGHTPQMWRYQDTPVLMTGSTYQRGFTLMEVKGKALMLTFYGFNKEGELKPEKPITLYDAEGRLKEPEKLRVFNSEDLFRVPAGSPPEGVRVAWSRSFGASIQAQPAVSGDRGYSINYTGELVCTDMKARKMLWKFGLGGGYIFSDPAANGDMVYIGTMGGKYFAIEDRFQRPAQTAQLGAAVGH
jgi:hypothetical protein